MDMTAEQTLNHLRQMLAGQMGGGTAMPGTQPQAMQPPPGRLCTKIFSFDLEAKSGANATDEINRWIESVSARSMAMQPMVLGVGARLVVAFLYRDTAPAVEGK